MGENVRAPSFGWRCFHSFFFGSSHPKALNSGLVDADCLASSNSSIQSRIQNCLVLPKATFRSQSHCVPSRQNRFSGTNISMSHLFVGVRWSWLLRSWLSFRKTKGVGVCPLKIKCVTLWPLIYGDARRVRLGVGPLIVTLKKSLR